MEMTPERFNNFNVSVSIKLQRLRQMKDFIKQLDI